MNFATKKVRTWNNKTRKLFAGGVTAADILKQKYGDHVPAPLVVNADTYKQYRMFKSYKQVGEVWELRNMSIDAPDLFVYDGFLYVKHIKQGNKTHVKYLRVSPVSVPPVSVPPVSVPPVSVPPVSVPPVSVPPVFVPPVSVPSVFEPNAIDKGLFKQFRMYIGNNDVWELRNPAYFNNPPKQFVYNGYLYTLLPDNKQKNKTHKKYKQTLYSETKEPETKEPETKEPETKEPLDEDIDITPVNPVKSSSEIEKLDIQTLSNATYKNLRMYKAPTKKGDIWEMRNKEYFDNPIEKFVFEGFLY